MLKAFCLSQVVVIDFTFLGTSCPPVRSKYQFLLFILLDLSTAFFAVDHSFNFILKHEIYKDIFRWIEMYSSTYI